MEESAAGMRLVNFRRESRIEFGVEREGLVRSLASVGSSFDAKFLPAARKFWKQRGPQKCPEREVFLSENFRLDGKATIVTGAGSGIGQAIARRFAQCGAKVYLVDIRREQAEETAHLIREDGGLASVAVACDVTDAKTTEREFGRIASEGRIDILVNSAGVSNIGRIENTSEEDFERLFRVNVKGVYLCMKAAIEPMKRAGGGVIVNLPQLPRPPG